MTQRYFNRSLQFFTWIVVFWGIILELRLTVPDNMLYPQRLKVFVIALSICSYFWLQGLVIALVKEKLADEVKAGIAILSILKQLKG